MDSFTRTCKCWTYLQQLCTDTGCCLEAMDDRDEWQERVREIHASSMTSWWWWVTKYQNNSLNISEAESPQKSRATTSSFTQMQFSVRTPFFMGMGHTQETHYVICHILYNFILNPVKLFAKFHRNPHYIYNLFFAKLDTTYKS